MKQIITLIFIGFLNLNAFAQIGAITENLIPLGQWDDDTLPTHFFGTFNDIWGYTADDREYIVMGSAAHIHIFDVTDPSNLQEIERFEPGSSNTWRDFKRYENYMYAVMDGSSEGLLVIDMSDLPNSASIVHQSTDEFTSAHNCFIDEANGRLYVVGSVNSVLVYDLTQNPAEPTFLSSLSLDGIYIHDIYVRDNIAYCSAANDGYYIYDLTDAENPVFIASVVTDNYNHSSWLTDDGKYALYAEEVPTGLPLGIIDLENMMSDDIQVTTTFQEMLIEVEEGAEKNTPHNPFILGDKAFVSYYEDGIHIYDMSDPTQPTLWGYYDTYPQNEVYNGYAGCWGVYPYLPSGNIFASDMANGLIAFRLADDTATKELPTFAQDIQVFPNPVGEKLQIKVESETAFRYELTNALGQQWSRGALNFGNNQLNVKGLNSGMYYLSIYSNQEVYTQKIIKE